MLFVSDSFVAIRDFMELGGPILRWIAVVIFFMWALITERILYFRSEMSILSEEIHEKWEARGERRSWNAHQIREQMISQFSMATNSGIPMIQTLVALCPLMGLMGTVTGMIEVFQVMADTGGGDAKAMAGGVSRATIPTMAGMVGAISGVFASSYLKQKAQNEMELLGDHLTMDH